MKRFIICISCILSVFLLLLSGCVQEEQTDWDKRIIQQDCVYYDTEEDVTVMILGDSVYLEDCPIDNGNLVLPTEFYGGIVINSVGESAFMGNESIVNLTVPDGYEHIDYFAFMDCKNLKTVYLGEDVSYISGSSFMGSVNIENFTVAENNPYLYSVDGCVLSRDNGTLIATNGNIPEETKIISESLFCSRTDIAEVILPDGLSEIGESAFSDTDLKEIYIPESVETIGKYAFSQLDGITINCEAGSVPNGWSEQWLEGSENYTVNWGVE